MNTVGGLNPFDWLLLLILIWSTLAAFLRGFVRVAASLVGWAVGVLVANLYYAKLAPYLLPYCKTEPLAAVVAWVLLLGAVVVAASLLGQTMHKAAKGVGLSTVNRACGALVGAGRGCLIGASLVGLLAAFLPKSPMITESKLRPYFLVGAHAVSFIVPADLQSQVAKGSTRLRNAVPGMDRSK